VNKATILIADDNRDILESLKQLLKYDFSDIITLSNPDPIPGVMEKEAPDLVLLDMNFSPGATSGEEGLHWLRVILEADPSAVVILITAYGDANLAVRAMREGGTDFIVKPWDPQKLLATVSSAYKLRQSRNQVKNLEHTSRYLADDINRQFDILVGNSPGLNEILEVAYKAASSDASILITGENGTGKELVAREIHRISGRSGNSFIGVDLGSLNESLFESEMFGHVKGSFTDAREDRKGRFEVASGGTLFLDEIGNLSMNLQSKMLRVLEENNITPVGSNAPVPLDIRLITATNRNLREMIGRNVFREDLLYRINTIEIRIPSLRDRPEDIPLLLDYFLRKFEQKYNKPKFRVSGRAYDSLLAYHWPGNIRELKHMTEKAVILNESGILEPKDFHTLDPLNAQVPQAGTYRLADIEKAALNRALEKARGNISKAAGLLDISRTTLYSKMDKYGL
jgi:DNA-binding NtrC family response regulator